MSITVDEQTAISRLVQFAQMRLVPATKSASIAGPLWLTKNGIGELFEATWWLIQGVEATYFPRALSDELIAAHRPAISDALQAYEEGGMSFFPYVLVSALKGRMDLKSLFSDPQDEGDLATEILFDLFGRWLMSSTKFVGDQLSVLASLSLHFMLEKDWNDLVRVRPRPDEIEVVLAAEKVTGESARITHATVLGGTSRILTHMAASRDFFRDAHEGMGNLLITGLPWLRHLDAWRLDFANDALDARFDAVTADLASVIAQQSDDSPERKAEFRSKFLHQVASLKQSWKTDHPMELAGQIGEG